MDLRDFISLCEREGQLKRVKAEVDWNLELSHIAKLNEEAQGPALLFENVKGNPVPVLTSAFTTRERFAIALGLPLGTSMCEMARHWMKLATKELIPPRKVDGGPVLEVVEEGEQVDLWKFPTPYMYPMDGGRFIGTAVYLVTRDPDTGWVNLGTYRMQILDEHSVGIQIIKGKHADFMLKKYRERGERMPAAAVIGGDPLGFLTGSTLVGAGVCEYDVMGALRGEPVEVFESELTGLPLMANAEIILEGFVETDPDKFRQEGPFGEYTGYYSGKKSDEWPKPWLDVKRVLRRKDCILWSTTVGKPITDTHMVQSLNRTAALWTDLETMRVPGIQSVYIPASSTGRFWAIVSVKTMYPGHSNHVGTAVISTTLGHYGVKGVIVVDDDIPADDWDKVMWALSVRYEPNRSTQIIQRGRSTPLDPSLPINARDIVGRVILDATIPYEWERKPIEIRLDPDVKRRVLARWEELGLSPVRSDA
ncbi:MAG: phenylphosphate carboxylase subunit beta [Candidatus Dadabacteria bacterium]|nr:MAG: phenylphosphate carboxylase subunit beta [Candidatus Dadabacteria bacterium]